MSASSDTRSLIDAYELQLVEFACWLNQSRAAGDDRTACIISRNIAVVEGLLAQLTEE